MTKEIKPEIGVDNHERCFHNRPAGCGCPYCLAEKRFVPAEKDSRNDFKDFNLEDLKTHKDVEPIFEDILRIAKERRDTGAKTYGDLTFLNKDNLKEAEEELVDLVNYAMFKIVELRVLRKKLLSNPLYNPSSNG